MSDADGGGQRRGRRKDNPQFSNPDSKAFSLQRANSSIKHVRIEEEDEDGAGPEGSNLTPSSSNRSLLADEATDSFPTDFSRADTDEKKCLGANCRATGPFVQRNGYCADCNRKEEKAAAPSAAAPAGADPASVRFGRAGSTRAGLATQGSTRTGLGLQAGAARLDRGMSARTPLPPASADPLAASTQMARQPSRMGTWKSIGRQGSTAVAAGAAPAASQARMEASSRNLSRGFTRGQTGLQQQGTVRELRFAASVEDGARSGGSGKDSVEVRGIGTARGMSMRGASRQSFRSGGAGASLPSEPEERKEAVRQSFVADMEAYMRQSALQLITLFQKLNCAGQRGRIASDVLLEGLSGLPLLMRDPDGDGSWDEKERHRWLKFLVRAVTDQDKHVTFADMVMLCEWNAVKEREPFRALRTEQDDQAWVVAAEVAEVLVGKYGSLNRAFNAIDKDRSRKIERAELLQGIQGAGLVLSKAEAKLLFRHIDRDGSGEIDYKEFNQLMDAGKEQFNKFKQDSEAKAKQKKEFDARVREIQEVLSSWKKFEDLAQAMHAAGRFRQQTLDLEAVIDDEVQGMSPGTDDVVHVDDLYDAVFDARIGLSKPMVDALMLLAPRREVWKGNIKELQDPLSFVLDTSRRAVNEDIAGCEIWLASEGTREVRTIVEFADGKVSLDEPAEHPPTLSTFCEVVDPHQVCYLGLIQEVNAMMEAYKESKKEKEQDKQELQKLDALAEADIAQIVRAIQMKKINAINAAWHIFDPQRKNSISTSDFAAGIERLGLEVHLGSTVLDVQVKGKQLGCGCHEQWSCPNPECGAWNEVGGGYDSRAMEQARQADLKKTQQLQQKRSKEEYAKLPWITLNCNQLMLGTGGPTLKLDFVPTTWTWTEVRLELRNRVRKAVWIVFEGRQVMSQQGWAECVRELEQDWVGEQELQGELNVDLMAMCCFQCQHVAPVSFPVVGPSWRDGHKHEELCPLAQWQLQHMLRKMDDNTDLQVQYSEFAQTFDKKLQTDPRELDAQAVVSLVKLRGVRMASTVRKRAGAEQWDEVWLWITDDKLCYAARMDQHGTPKKTFLLAAMKNLEGVGKTGFKFQVMEKDDLRTHEFQALSLDLKEKLVSTILSPPDSVRRVDVDFTPQIAGVGKTRLKPAARTAKEANAGLQRVPSGRQMPNKLEQQSTLPKVARGMTASDLFAGLSATTAPPPTKPELKTPAIIARQPSAAGPPDIKLDNAVSERLHRMAGPAMGVTGAIHHLHRAVFDRLHAEPVSLASSNGHVTWHASAEGCTAVLVLWAGRHSASYRIACYCLFLHGVTGEGPDGLWHSLRPGHAFQVRTFTTNRSFHCQIRKSTHAMAAHDNEPQLELMVSGQTKHDVVTFLTEGAQFGVDESQREVRAEHAVKCWSSFGESLQKAHDALNVAWKRGTARVDTSKRLGSLLGTWDHEKGHWEPAIALDAISSEMELIYGLVHVKAKLSDQLLDFRHDAKMASSAKDMSTRILKETGLKDKAGISHKERQALQQYWDALNALYLPARRINLKVVYSATLVRIGAWNDLKKLLSEVYSLIQDVKHAVPKREEDDRPCIRMEKGILCPVGVGSSKGEAYLFSRSEIIVGDQIQQCKDLERRVMALEPTLREGEASRAGSSSDKPSLDAAAEKCIEELQRCTKSLRDCTGSCRVGKDRLPSKPLDLKVLHLNARPLEVMRQLTVEDIDWEAERLDPFKGSEIAIHFLAAAVPNTTRAVSFSTQFFTLPRASTGLLPLTRAEDICSNHNTCGVPGKPLPPSLLHSHLSPICGSAANPGCIRLRVTPEHFSSEDDMDFANYLCSSPLEIEVWDAESCLSLGTIRIERMLRILRQGRPAVQLLHMEPVISTRHNEKQAHQLLQHNAAILPSKQHPIAGQTCGHEDQLGWGAGGVHRLQLMVLIVNTGFMFNAKQSEQSVALAAQALTGGEDSETLVRSWRSLGVQDTLQHTAIEGPEASGKSGMGGHARRLLKLREAGGLKRVAVLNMDREALPAASMHLEALHSLRRNRQYRDHQLKMLLRQLVVRERVLRPALGESPFCFHHPVDNPLSHPVLCSAYITSMDADAVTPDKRPYLEHSLHILPHSLAVPPSEVPADVPSDAFVALLQPSAEVRMQLQLDNTAETWQLNPYSARVLVSLSRITGAKEVVTQYEINFTFAPLPVTCHRHFRFFQSTAQLHRSIQVDVAPSALPPFSASALPDLGCTIELRSEDRAADGGVAVKCELGMNLNQIDDSKRHERTAEVEGTGWLNRSVATVYVVLRDGTGSIIQRWLVEAFRVQSKATEARRVTAKFYVSSEMIERRAFRLYSSDLTKLPIWGTHSLVLANPHNALFAVKRGLKDEDGIFVHLVCALDARRARKTPEVTLLVDDALQCDDADSVKLGEMVVRAGRVLRGMRKEPVCSKEDMSLLKESGILAFPNSGLANEAVVSKEQLHNAIIIGKQALKDKRLPNTFNPGSSGPHNGVDSTCFVHALKATPQVRADGQEIDSLGGKGEIFKGQVVSAWLLKVAEDEKNIEGLAAQFSEKDKVGVREGARPVIRYEPSCFHTWATSDLDSLEDNKARQRQVAAIQRQVYRGDKTGRVEQWFSVFEAVREIVMRYSYLTPDDKPQGPFADVVKEEAKAFFLHAPGHEGFIARDEICDALTDVPWEFKSDAAGEYSMKLQGVELASQPDIAVPKTIKEMSSLISEKDRGYQIISSNLRRRARKMVVASFNKLFSWGAVGGVPMLYRGKGVDRAEAERLRGGDNEVETVARADADEEEPIEIVVVSVPMMHLDLEEAEWKDFLVDHHNAKQHVNVSDTAFPHYYSYLTQPRMPTLEDVRKNPSALGFWQLRPTGRSLVGRRVKVFCDRPMRHGWNECIVTEYNKGEDGVRRHLLKFEDGAEEEEELDRMDSSLVELVPDASHPEMFLNTSAMLLSLCEDLHLVLTAFANMVATYNRKSKRPAPGWSGYLKATSLPWISCLPPHARQQLITAIDPLLREALHSVLLEDRGGFCQYISVLEVPQDWKLTFPASIETVHRHRAAVGGSGAGCHKIKVVYGQLRDLLLFTPEDLWDYEISQGLLPGVLSMSEIMSMPGNQRAQSSNGREDLQGLLETLVADHTDLRLVQSFWFNHNLLNTSRMVPVQQPLCCRERLTLSTLHEARTLFKNIDLDNSNNLSQAECATFLSDALGYLDEEIDVFMEQVDRNQDGSVSWTEFLEGAMSLSRRELKPAGPTVRERGQSVALEVIREDRTKASVEVSESMAWTQVHSQLESLGLSEYYLEYTDVVVVRELMVEAETIFEQLDDDKSGALDRGEIQEKLELPTDKGGHWGFSRPQVEEFIRAADEDGSGSIDEREFLTNASYMLLCHKDPSLAPNHGGHRLSGLTYGMKEQGSSRVHRKPLRVKCRHEAEWEVMKKRLFPTKEVLQEEVRQVEGRLGSKDDEFAEQKKKELQRERRQKDKEKSELAKAEAKEERDKLQGKRVPKTGKKKVSKKMQDIMDEIAEIDEEIAREKEEIKEGRRKRRKVFVEHQIAQLQKKDEKELRKLCAELHGGECTHSKHSDAETLSQVAEALHNSLEGELKRTKQQLKEMMRDEDQGIAIEVSIVRARQYSLRCFLHEEAHPPSSFIEEISGEWHQHTDKQTGASFWSSAYSLEQRKNAPTKLALLENKTSGHRFLRKFAKWERAGIVIPISDVTTWADMRLRKLRGVFQEEFFLVARQWSTVRSEEDWKDMKSTFVQRGVDAPQVIVVREKARDRNKTQHSRLPRWWTREDSLARGWQEVYDDSKRQRVYKFTPPPGDKSKPTTQLSFPADHIADIQWRAKGQPPSRGKDVLKALREPPYQLDTKTKICVNKVTQQVSWVPPETVEDACAVRVSIRAGLVIQSGELKVRALKPGPGQDSAPAPLVPDPISIPYSAKQDKDGLGGWVLRPSMTWDALKAYLRDKIPPVGKDKNCWYWFGRQQHHVEHEMDWKDCLVYLMSNLAVYVKLQSDHNDATGSNLRVDKCLDDKYGLYPKPISILQIQVLDAEAEERSKDGEGKSGGIVMLGGSEFHLKGAISMREDNPWADMLVSLTSLCKTEAVFKYLRPTVVAGEQGWHRCIEEYVGRRDKLREHKDLRTSDGRREAVLDAKIRIEDPYVDLLVDERTKWSQVLFQLRESCAGEVVGLMRGGREVRDEAGWRGLLTRSLADRYQGVGGASGGQFQLSKVAYESLVVLAKALREDKTGPMTMEMERRREEREGGGKGKDGKDRRKEAKKDGRGIGGREEEDGREEEEEEREKGVLTGTGDGEKTIPLVVEDCVPLLASANKTIMQAEMEFALRRFRFCWRLAKEGEVEGDKPPPKLSRGGWGQSQKDLRAKKTKEETLPDSVMEVVRRTRKGKEKIKGAILLRYGWTEAYVMPSGGAKARTHLSSCPRAAEDRCCQGLIWDTRSTILAQVVPSAAMLYQAVDIGSETNVLEYRGPHTITVKPGLHSLKALGEAIWQQVVEQGRHPSDEVEEKLQIDLDASRESHQLADGWAGPYVEGEEGAEREVYVHEASGRRSEEGQGRPCKLKALGRGKFVPLAWEESSMLTKGVFWSASEEVLLEPTATALVYCGPHRLTIPPAAYDLPELQRTIDKLLSANSHPPLRGASALSPAFSFSAVNDQKKGPLPPGWQRRIFKPSEAYIPPMPPASGNRAGREYFVNLSLGHAQWEEPKSRVQLSVLRAGFQLDMQHSSLRAILGFGAEPPLLPQNPPLSGSGGKHRTFVAKTAPMMSFSDLRRCLSQVVMGAANVILEYAATQGSGQRGDDDQGSAEQRRQVDKPAAWDELLAHLRRKAQAGGGGAGGQGKETEVMVDLVLVKTGDHRRKALQGRD